MYLLFDIGATKMRLALAADWEKFAAPKVVPTPEGTAAVARTFAEAARELLAGESPVALAGGITRKHEAAKAEIAKIFDCPSYIENDAALGALGEALTAARRAEKIVAYFTISTGVGGARIVDGKIDEKMVGFEPGKQIMMVNGERKTLEQLVSGRALAEKWGQAPKELTDAAIWEDLAEQLALGLHNSLLHWSPSVVILGGSMMTGQPAIDLAVVERHLAALSGPFPAWPALGLATLGDFSGLHGALHFLRQNLSNI